MNCTNRSAEAGQFNEMAIVDTFTKLIFEDEGEFSPLELDIIQALRLVDDNVIADSHREMGCYLRALGVSEMVELVSLVSARLMPVPPRGSLDEGMRGMHRPG